MAEVTADCPRCGATRATFDVFSYNLVGERYDWQRIFELYSVCRHCLKGTILLGYERSPKDLNFLVRPYKLEDYKGSLDRVLEVGGYVGLRHSALVEPPEHLPPEIDNAFNEAATCLAVECYNAAAAMFRLCLDLATRPLLPAEETEGLNQKTRRDLGLRLRWLFDNGTLPESLRELSACVREDGNDGVHAGNLSKDDADDLLDFSTEMMKRMFTEPKRLELAKERRNKRREQP